MGIVRLAGRISWSALLIASAAHAQRAPELPLTPLPATMVLAKGSFSVTNGTGSYSFTNVAAGTYKLRTEIDADLQPTSADTLKGHDVVFLALPHGASANRSDRPRLAQYVNMYPMDWPDQRVWV